MYKTKNFHIWYNNILTKLEHIGKTTNIWGLYENIILNGRFSTTVSRYKIHDLDHISLGSVKTCKYNNLRNKKCKFQQFVPKRYCYYLAHNILLLKIWYVQLSSLTFERIPNVEAIYLFKTNSFG